MGHRESSRSPWIRAEHDCELGVVLDDLPDACQFRDRE
jgi:hypothetical protein